MSRLVRLSLLVALTGCASAPVVDSHRVRFTSEPPDAIVKVAGQSCVTPCMLRLPPGDHPAEVLLNEEKTQAVLVSSDNKPSLKQNVQAAVGTTLQTTGTVLDAVGEATIQVFIGSPQNGTYSDKGAVVLLAFGAIGITGKLAGQLLIKTGDGMVKDAADPEPIAVHIVFSDARWSGPVMQPRRTEDEYPQDNSKAKLQEE